MSLSTTQGPDVMGQDTEAEAEITRISSSWEKHPKKATVASAAKLVIAFSRVANAVVGRDIEAYTRPTIAKCGKADWDDIASIRDDIEDNDGTVGTKIVRDRLKDLVTMFGSPKNLVSYQNALRSHTFRCRNGKRKLALTVGSRCSPSQIAWKDEKQLFSLLCNNLGEPVVKCGKLWTAVSSVELAEMIGLKLALGMRHMSTDVPEVSEFDAKLRHIAWLTQRMTNRPERMGDLNPSELAKSPRERYSAEDGEPEMCMVTKVNGQLRVGLRSDDIHVGTEEKYVGIATMGHHGCPNRFTQVKLEEQQVVSSNVSLVPLPKPIVKDWDDLWVFVRAPTMYKDHTQEPDKDGEFPMLYSGPSFVEILDGVPVHPGGRCIMHDGYLWYMWQKDGKQGECPKCAHVHIRNANIREDHWAPKVRFENTYLDPDTNEPYTVTTTLPGDASKVHLVAEPSNTGKTSKWVLKFDHEDLTMPMMVPEFRSAIQMCLATRTFACPPLLEEKVVYTNGQPKPKRYGVMHAFLEMKRVAYLFDRRTLPDAKNMAIRVQLGGFMPHLRVLCNDLNGDHMKSIYRVVNGNRWVLQGTNWA